MSKGAWWPLAIAGVLMVTVGANGYLLFRATDGTMSLEPDYYHKAVLWDSTMAQATRNVALGWTIDSRLDAEGILWARVLDRDGLPVLPSLFRAQGFPIGTSGGEFTVDFARGAERRPLPVPLHGGALYEVRFEAVRGADRFTAALRGRPGDRLAARP